MPVVNDFELDKDFFEYNSHLKLPFNKIITKPGSHEKHLSVLMWTIALMEDYDSNYFNHSREDRIVVAREMTGLPKDVKLPNDLVEIYNKLQFDSEKRFLETWNRKVDELDSLLKRTEITLQNHEEITKALEKVNKLLADKDKLMDRIRKKRADNVRGNRNLSMLEQDGTKI